ncbi:RNA-binding protein 40 [Pelomyxa schiedti]|nr:RNA-binding protein 40 [Pelomyxa schiedti]
MAGSADQREVTLRVKHLPASLSEESVRELFSHYGATSVACLHGSATGHAVVTFGDTDQATQVIEKFNNAKLLDKILVVELDTSTPDPNTKPRSHHPNNNVTATASPSNNGTQSHLQPQPQSQSQKQSSVSTCALQQPAKNSNSNVTSAPTIPSCVDTAQRARSVGGTPICSNLGINYPANPTLAYRYPPPTTNTVINIASAICSIPMLYTQVLNLMNKMNLPPPFGELVTPHPLLQPALQPKWKSHPASSAVGAGHKHFSSSSESDSDTQEDAPAQRGPKRLRISSVKPAVPKKETIKIVEKPRVKTSESGPKPETLFLRQSQIPAHPSPSPICITLPQSGSIYSASTQSPMPMSVTHIEQTKSANLQYTQAKSGLSQEVDVGPLPKESPPTTTNVASTATPIVTLTTTPTTANIPQPETALDSSATAGDTISLAQIIAGKLTSAEFSAQFPNHQAGAPSSKLYLKNLHKKSNRADLTFVFGRYFPPEERVFLDINLLPRGKKSTAFISFPSISSASQALTECQGYKLHDTPMLIEFSKQALTQQP